MNSSMDKNEVAVWTNTAQHTKDLSATDEKKKNPAKNLFSFFWIQQ